MSCDIFLMIGFHQKSAIKDQINMWDELSYVVKKQVNYTLEDSQIYKNHFQSTFTTWDWTLPLQYYIFFLIHSNFNF